MSLGTTVKCGRCTQKFNIYNDIHKQIRNEKFVSVCPHCNNIEGHNFDNGFTFDYNAGDEKDGCPSHVEDEEQYDWEWLDYNIYAKPVPDNDTRDFDQDPDIINDNLGWETG